MQKLTNPSNTSRKWFIGAALAASTGLLALKLYRDFLSLQGEDEKNVGEIYSDEKLLAAVKDIEKRMFLVYVKVSKIATKLVNKQKAKGEVSEFFFEQLHNELIVKGKTIYSIFQILTSKKCWFLCTSIYCYSVKLLPFFLF